MRLTHAAVAIEGLAEGGEAAQRRIVLSTSQGILPMFVRAVWRLKRLVDIKQTLREMDVPSTRDADILGISGPDFSKMTRSLFDR
jgi:hypothetical protein